ncbi:MAG: hypothetical protein ABI859_03165 [Pseudomonadota bacterium]
MTRNVDERAGNDASDRSLETPVDLSRRLLLQAATGMALGAPESQAPPNRMEIKTHRNGGARMSAVRATEYCSVRIDEFPTDTPRRPAAPGCFAAGVNICTLTRSNLDAVKAALTQAQRPFTEVASNTCPPFQGARGVYLLGLGGERSEIMQVAVAL